MCCTKRREDRVAVSNQLTVLSRTLKKSVPPEIVNRARQAMWPRTVSIPASSIVPCPTCNGPNLTSYVRRSPTKNAPFLIAIPLTLRASGRDDRAGNAPVAIIARRNDERSRGANINRGRNIFNNTIGLPPRARSLHYKPGGLVERRNAD